MTTGVWLAGARGSVATTVITGALAVQAGLAARSGIPTESPAFAGLGLPPVEDLVFGGHDFSEVPLQERAEALAGEGVLPATLPSALPEALAAVDRRLRPARAAVAETQQEQLRRLVADLVEFRAATGAEQVVVVNLTSTEPVLVQGAAHARLEALEAELAAGGAPLPPSSLYAYAAFRAGCGFVDFTPSAGARVPALEELAAQQGLPWAGSDGKTGETLLKSVLAPMFVARALHVRSWAGLNVLGGGDGAALADPARSASKTRSKSRVLPEILGYDVTSPVHIDDVPDMGEWKTAWDHVSFEGFLGVLMTLQFTW